MARKTLGCQICGHECRADRSTGAVGLCGAGTGIGFSSALIHHGEEPPLSGSPPGGSGTIFFTRCNLRCVFCQNWQISQEKGAGRDVGVGDLVDLMLQMAENGAYNINLVSPTPYALEIAKALDGARRQGLSIPVVYNTGGYDSLSTLSMLDGLIDIYLPDAKIAAHPSQKEGEPDQRSMRLCGAGDYPWVNRKAVLEMLRQVGHIKLDDNGLAKRGLFLRHLVLPDNLARTSHLLPWLADNLGPSLYLSLMAQYHPSHLIKIGDNPEFRDLPGLGRPLSVREYDDCKQIAWNHGLNNTFVQDLESAFSYRPDFTKPKVFS